MTHKKQAVVFATVLLVGVATLSLAIPTSGPDNKIPGTPLNDGRFRFDLPSTVTAVNDSSCMSHWSHNDVVVASADGFVPPVISVTSEMIMTEQCPVPLAYVLSCPMSGVDVKLHFSCEKPLAIKDESSDVRRHTAALVWLGPFMFLMLVTV